MAQEIEKTEKEQRGKMTVSEAGRKGGQAVRAKYGPEFFSKIGAQSHKSAHDPDPEAADRAANEPADAKP
jgi:hypothetical protein